MRCLALSLILLPSIGIAETFTLQSRITEVTVYPTGAKVTRVAPYTLPAGEHRLQLLDLPESADLDLVRAKVTGSRMGAVTLREDFVPPRTATPRPEIAAAEAEVDRRQDALRDKQDEAAALRLAREAADKQIGFLEQLGQGNALENASPDMLRDVARMVGEETLLARQKALQAEASARVVDREIADLKEELQKAHEALQALIPETERRQLVEVSVRTEAASDGELSVTYYVAQAGWAPLYDAFLTMGETAVLDLQRAASVSQRSGENWQDVALTLTTSLPEAEVQASPLYSDLKRITDQPVPMAKVAAEMRIADAEPMLETAMAPSPVVAEMSSLWGLTFTYRFPQTVSIASGADHARVALAALKMTPDLRAVAVPLYDETAFLSAEFRNDSGEMLLPSDQVNLYLNGEFVGATQTDTIAAGQETSLPFGAIEGLRLGRVRERNEGDRGILTKSNEITETAKIEIENLTGQSWPIRLLDRVPHSEQEDLVIDWSASPVPDQEDFNDRKGVLAWDFDLAAGQTKEISVQHRLSWPEDMMLR